MLLHIISGSLKSDPSQTQTLTPDIKKSIFIRLERKRLTIRNNKKNLFIQNRKADLQSELRLFQFQGIQ